MQFGYFANQNNRLNQKAYGQVMAETVELAQYMDQHDWHSIWFTEHHFGHEGFEVCPNPVMMSTWAAAHTKRLRLGQAANIITFWNPLRFAEDLAMLDHMSGGRMILGLGVSGPQVVEGWYGQPYSKPVSRTREYVDIIRQVLAREAVHALRKNAKKAGRLILGHEDTSPQAVGERKIRSLYTQ